jgi:hypothetical protein
MGRASFDRGRGQYGTDTQPLPTPSPSAGPAPTTTEKNVTKPGYHDSGNTAAEIGGAIASGLWDSAKSTWKDVTTAPPGTHGWTSGAEHIGSGASAIGSRLINGTLDLGAAALNVGANAWNSIINDPKKPTFRIPNVTAPDINYDPTKTGTGWSVKGGSLNRAPAIGTLGSLGVYVPGNTMETLSRGIDVASLIPAIKGVKTPRIKIIKPEDIHLDPGLHPEGKSPGAGPEGPSGGGTQIKPIKIPPTRPTGDLSPLPPRGGFTPKGSSGGPTATLTRPEVQPKTKPIDWPEWKPEANPEYQAAPEQKIDTPDALAPRTNLNPARVRLITPQDNAAPKPNAQPNPNPGPGVRPPAGVTTASATEDSRKKRGRDSGAFDMSIGYQNVHPLTTW